MDKNKELNIKKRQKQLNELRDFNEKTQKLKHLQEKSERTPRLEKITILKNIMETLTPLYNENLQKVREFIKISQTRNERLFSQTTFEVMDRHTKENAHSRVIAYLLNKKPIGKKLLKEIINQLPEKSKENIVPFIDKSDYTTKTEEVIKRKRIDIFIDSKNFFIVIENKFNANLHDVEEESQTDFYYRELIEKYPDKNSAFIILDYKEEEESDNYTTLGYYDLLHTLEIVKNDFEKDNVFLEYYYLLRRLLYNIDERFIESLDTERNLSKLNNIKIGVSKCI